MFTLRYLKNQFNRPDTLMSFLQSNIGQSPLLRIDSILPYQGTEQDLIGEVCDFFNRIALEVEVTYTSVSHLMCMDGPPYSPYRLNLRSEDQLVLKNGLIPNRFLDSNKK